MVRSSSVCTLTRYGQDGPGIETRFCGDVSRTFPHRP